MKLTFIISFLFICVVGMGQNGYRIAKPDSTKMIKSIPMRYLPDWDSLDLMKNDSTNDFPSWASAKAIFDSKDSLTTQRFITDSIGDSYMVEYKYASVAFGTSSTDSASYSNHKWNNNATLHAHYIAICSIIWYKGNKQKTIAQNIKAIYSPTECASDNEKLWLERIKKYLK